MGQNVKITALIKDITTQLDRSSVILDGTNLNGNASIRMVDDGSDGDEVTGDNVYTAEISITNDSTGTFNFTISASDIVPNSTTRTGYITFDNTPPTINFTLSPEPRNTNEFYQSEVILTNSFFDLPDSNGIKDVKFSVKNTEGDIVYYDELSQFPIERRFKKSIPLIPGDNILIVKAEDKVSNITTIVDTLTYIVPEVSKVIGADGGEIESPDGTKLVIPAGALLKATKLTIKRVSASELVPPSDTAIHLMSVAHLFEPEGLVFHKSVQMVLTYTDFDLDKDQDGVSDVSEGSLAPFFYDGYRWIKADAGVVDSASNTITLMVNHLSIYDIGVDNRVLPTDFTIYLTRNPFRLNEGTTIVFTAPSAGVLTVKIYDLSGDLVATVVKDFNISGRGEYSIRWNGLSQFNRFIGSGIYIYVAYFRSTTGEEVIIRKPIGVVK